MDSFTQASLFGEDAVFSIGRPIFSAILGDNSDLLPGILSLYAKRDDKIADVTYGQGVFWKKVDRSQFSLFLTDIMSGMDMTAMAYANESLDMVVLDPPYQPQTGRNSQIQLSLNERYKVWGAPRTQAGILNLLYAPAIKEAWRVLKPNGILLVKCQDAVEGGKQVWMHIDIFGLALETGFAAEDLFVLVKGAAPMRHKTQQHARKNHSFMWVFRK